MARVISLLTVYYNGEIKKNEQIRNKNCLWRPCLLTDRNEMSNLYRAPSIDASYQVSVHFGREVSEEKIKMWKVNGQRMPSDGKNSHCLWQGELKNMYRVIYVKWLGDDWTIIRLPW